MKTPAKYEHIESDRQARKMPITFGGAPKFLVGRPRVWRFTNVCPRMYVRDCVWSWGRKALVWLALEMQSP